MADTPEFQILIKYLKDDKAAKDAAAELNTLKTKTQEVGKASEEAGKKGTEATKEHTKHIEGLHKATGLLFRQFGELGHLMHGFVSLPALGITAIAVGIHKGVEYAEQLREKVIEARKEIENLNAANINGLNASLASGIAAVQKAQLDRGNAGDQTDPIGQQFKDKRARMEAEAKARGGTLTAQQERQLIQEEFEARQGAAPGLNAAATQATLGANAPDPALNAAKNKLAAALAKEPALVEAVAKASAPTLGMAAQAVMGAALGDQTKEEVLQELINRKVGTARSALDANTREKNEAQRIINDRTFQHAILDDNAARANAAASGNLKAMGGLVGTASTFEAGQTGGLMGRLPSLPKNSPTAKLVEFMHANGEKDDSIVDMVTLLLDHTVSIKSKMALLESRVKTITDRQ